MGCIFCSIAAGQIPAQVVYEDDRMLAFRDINPVAPEHVLVIPKAHVGRIDEEGAMDFAADVFRVIARLAGELGLAERGYRVVCNSGPEGGQSVDHLHFHVLGGRQLQWPPG